MPVYALIGTSGATIPRNNGNNTFSGAVVFTSAYTVTISAKSLVVNQTKITTNDTELFLQQTGDELGSMNVYLRNRTGGNGLLVHNPSLDLCDFMLMGSSFAQRNIRFENRGGSAFVAAGEMQFGPAGDPALVSSDDMVLVRRGALRFKEQTAAPANPLANGEMQQYMKGDKCVLAYNDGGTMKYRTMTLGGTANPAVWDYSTSAP